MTTFEVARYEDGRWFFLLRHGQDVLSGVCVGTEALRNYATVFEGWTGCQLPEPVETSLGAALSGGHAGE